MFLLVSTCLVALQPAPASASGVEFVTPSATMGGVTAFSDGHPADAQTLEMDALIIAVPPAVDVAGTEQNPIYPIAGATVYFSVETENGIWWNVCSAVTDDNGDAVCTGQGPDIIVNGVAQQIAAWSAVYQGSYFVYSGSSDYGRIPGTADPAPTTSR